MFLRSDLMDTHAVLIYSSMRIGPEGSKLNCRSTYQRFLRRVTYLKSTVRERYDRTVEINVINVASYLEGVNDNQAPPSSAVSGDHSLIQWQGFGVT
jgi:hypothetical protein